jgi:hypothetical protein
MKDTLTGYARSLVTAETHLTILPPNVKTGAALAIVEVLPDNNGKEELRFRIIQNCGTTNIYISKAFDQVSDVDNVFHDILPPLAQLDCSAFDKAVYAMCPDAALKVSTCVGIRD